MVRIAVQGFEASARGALSAAAAERDAELVFVTPSQVMEGAPFDLVLCAGTGLRKLTSHPTFLWVDGPPACYAADAAVFAAACAFDGHLCPDPSGARLFERIAVSLGRPLTTPITLPEPVAAALAALAAFEPAHAAAVAPFAETGIDVVMRTGGRDPAVVRRAVDSLRGQSSGHIRLIVVRHGCADPADFAPSGRLAEVEIVEAPGANRGRALAAGLAAVRSPFFSILDDDDYLLRDHFAGLCAAMAEAEAEGEGGHGFAYCDVLRLDADAHPTDAPLSILKEGPAAGPLTAVLERLPSHSFLGRSAILKRVRTTHWDMATAEDSLLIASLLRHSTPVRSPNATAVYSQGGSDGSGFGDHPQRRADEVALHAETFAWRARIEARFPAAAPDPLEHLRPALRRLEAEVEGRAVGRVVPIDAPNSMEEVQGSDAFLGGVLQGERALFVRVPMTSDRVSGAALYFEPQPGGVQIGRQEPWEVGLRVDVADYVLPGVQTLAVAVLKGEGPSASLGLLDAADTLIERTSIADTTATCAAEVHGPRTGVVKAVVVQAGPEGAAFLRLAELRLGYGCDAARKALGFEDDGDDAALGAALLGRFGRQIEGAPANPPPLHPLQDAGPVFRRPVPLTEGSAGLADGSTGTEPWDYFAQVPVPADAGGAEAAPGWIRLELGPTTEGFTAFMVDRAFAGRLSRVYEVKAGKTAVELWIPAPREDAWIVMQAGAEPKSAALSVRAVELSW